MKKIITLALALLMLVSLAACGTTTNTPSGNQGSTPADQQSTDKPGDNTSEPASGVVITDMAKTVARLMGVELTKMFPDAIVIDGNVATPNFRLMFLFEGRLLDDENKAVLETLSAYLKSVAKDGKLYQDSSFNTEWNEQIVIEDGQVLGEEFYVKLGDYGWYICAAYQDEPGMEYENVMYPDYYLIIERIDLS